MLEKKYNIAIPPVAPVTIAQAANYTRLPCNSKESDTVSPIRDTSNEFVRHLDTYIRRAVQSEDTAHLISQLSCSIEG